MRSNGIAIKIHKTTMDIYELQMINNEAAMEINKIQMKITGMAMTTNEVATFANF